MPTIYDCDSSELVEKAAEELKKIDAIEPPTWTMFVKTGVHKERPPTKKDWWYVRSASILKQIYRLGPIGVSKLRTKYGGKKNRGVKTEHFYKGSGSIIRKIIQQLEKEGFVKKDQKNKHKGRVITAKGKKFLDDIAAKISKVTVEKVEKKEEPKKEANQEKKTEQTKQEEKTKETKPTKADKETSKK